MGQYGENFSCFRELESGVISPKLLQVQSSWEDIQSLSSSQAKAQVLEILSTWSLFGSSFFAVSSSFSVKNFISTTFFGSQVRRETEPRDSAEHIMALNKNGVSFLDLITHETLFHYPYTEVRNKRDFVIDAA